MSAEVVALRPRSAEVDVTSLQSKLEIYQRINREWAHELDPYERVALLAVVDRTIGWGKVEARFSAGRLLNGDQVCGPLNMSRRQLYRALSSLEQKGFISRRHPVDLPEITFYSVHPNRSQTMALNLPKRLKNPATRCNEPVPDRHTTVPHGHTPVPDRHPIYSNPLTDSHSTGSPGAALADHAAPDPVSSIREIVATTVVRHAAARSARREKLATKTSAASVETAWRMALAETFPDAVELVWTGREKGQAKRLTSGWTHTRQISFIDFTDWAVRNWTQIMAKQFRWMKQSKPPAVPAFAFYAAMLDQFAECWSEGKLEEWANADERTEVERLMTKGMTFEQATAEAAKRHAVGALRDEMRDHEIKVRARTRMADQKLEQAKKLAEYGGAAPPHPQSAVAKALRAETLRARPEANPATSTLPVDEFAPLSAPMVDPNRNPFDE